MSVNIPPYIPKKIIVKTDEKDTTVEKIEGDEEAI